MRRASKGASRKICCYNPTEKQAARGAENDRIGASEASAGGAGMAKKPGYEDAKLILKLYDLRREPEMRKARQWWLTAFWPESADDFLKVFGVTGTPENNWFRQVVSYWGIVAALVKEGILNEKLFLQPSFSGELFFILAKSRPFLTELRERTKNPDLMLNLESAILGSKAGRAQYAKMEPRVLAARPKK
jgi:hypothetical protein